jgi:hypothetical protein
MNERRPTFADVATLVLDSHTPCKNAWTIEKRYPNFDCNLHPPDFECSYVAAAAIGKGGTMWPVLAAFLCLSGCDPDFAVHCPWNLYGSGSVLYWIFCFCNAFDRYLTTEPPQAMRPFLTLLEILHRRDATKLATAINLTNECGLALPYAAAYQITWGLPSLLVRYGADLLISDDNGDKLLRRARCSLQELCERKPPVPTRFLIQAKKEVDTLFDNHRNQLSMLSFHL